MNKQFSFRAHENIALVKLLQQEIKNSFAGENTSTDSGIFSESGKASDSVSNSSSRVANAPTVSNSKIRRLIVAGQVVVNGKQIFVPSFTVYKNSIVTVQIDTEKFFKEREVDDVAFTLTERDVLFEDDVIIVVNKPSRFPTEQTITGNRANLHDEIVRYLWEKNPSLRNPPYVGIMHRLDRDTSGAILFTKSRCVNKVISEMFKERTIEKVYRAVASVPQKAVSSAGRSRSASGSSFVKGELPYSFNVKNYLARESGKTRQAKWHSVSASESSSASESHSASEKNNRIENALFAHTDFTVLRRSAFNGKDALFIEARPHTGRTHQIRVHLSESGMAIFGDTIYGGENAPRLMLHAYSLAFTHPTSGKRICVTAPLPKEFM